MAVFLWSSLASLTALSGDIPPFQLAAISFAIAGLLGVLFLAFRGSLGVLGGIPPAAWLLGIAGLFGYHFLYFLALRTAPALEANLINYLWPLLIVLLSAALPAGGTRERLAFHHIAGTALGLAGTILIVLDGGGADFEGSAWRGYAAAAGAAFVWAFYSVLSRRFAGIPSTAVAGFCLATAILAALCHLSFETTHWPTSLNQWLAVAGLGAGPVGLAFYVWDHGVKQGDIRVLGACAYAIPLLSTLLLVLLGLGKAGPMLWIACGLITAGAVLAAKDMLFARSGQTGS